MKRNDLTATQARRFVLILGIFLFAFIAVSLYIDLRGIREQHINLAAEVGRSFDQAIDAMRTWNLDHGGFYVRMGRDIQPNPHLRDPLRDVETTFGMKLTMVNHSQMTRLLSELLTDQRGIHIHITSQRPIRPENRPDAWEWQALDRLKHGNSEAYDVIGKQDAAIFRYMVPLLKTPQCLACHLQEAAATENTLGGISVSFSYVPFLKVIGHARRQVIWIHATFLIVGLALITLVGTKLVQSISALQDSLLRIKRLEGFLPICARCKKIRLEGEDRKRQESWIAIEQYIEDRTDAEFTHGLCPQCAKELYPGLSLG